jgi:FlaA1/EpsC-like NDP-sugar epimerase
VIDLRDAAVHQYLLGRRVRNVLAPADRKAFAGARVLITGGGGSVGSELARQVASCRPAHLTLFEQCECNLFRIESELREKFPALELSPVLGDVTRARSVRAVCETALPDVVFHAAAYKHVTMTERAVCAAVETNVLGTQNTALAARDTGARFLLISSDKAARPTSVMGATKRLAELAAISMAGPHFRPAVVRFGNVLASSGSLVEILVERIQQGRPVRLTHPEATRYFMTASEAAGLVLKADRLARAGEIYWLDMGAPVRVAALVQRVQELAEAAGYRQVRVDIVGLRPGEKLQEELTSQGLELRPTPARNVWMARQSKVDTAVIRRVIRALRHDVIAGNPLSALLNLRAAVPEFVHSQQAWAAAAAAIVGSVEDGRPYPGSLARSA